MEGRMTNDDYDAQVKRAVAEVKALCLELMPAEQAVEFLGEVIDELAELSEQLDQEDTAKMNDC